MVEEVVWSLMKLIQDFDCARLQTQFEPDSVDHPSGLIEVAEVVQRRLAMHMRPEMGEGVPQPPFEVPVAGAEPLSYPRHDRMFWPPHRHLGELVG